MSEEIITTEEVVTETSLEAVTVVTSSVVASGIVPTNIPEALKDRANIEFASGDTIKVTTKIKEANGKTRLQAFEGLCLARKHGNEVGGTFTIRKVASGVGVERIFPLYSSNIDKIEVVRHAKTRKSKLYYVRDKAMRDVRRKLKADVAKPSVVVEVLEEVAA